MPTAGTAVGAGVELRRESAGDYSLPTHAGALESEEDMPDDKCTACSFEGDGAPAVPSSPYITALAQLEVTGGDVERVVSWMCPKHREDYTKVVDVLREMPAETWPPKRSS